MKPSPDHALRCPRCGIDASTPPGSLCEEDGSVLVSAAAHAARPNDGVLGRLLGGKYAVFDLLGEGGLGAVYRAVQNPVGREVAVKTIIPRQGMEEELRQRFFREAKACAGLRHPAVVTLHDYGADEDGLLYMVLELIQGVELRDLIQKEAPLDPKRAADLLVPVLSALHAAHQQGLVHRDLKPENIMVTRGPLGEEAAKVLDFGIAKVLHSDTEDHTVATRAGIVVGSPGYLSPEQAYARGIGPASDLYSLGVVLFEMLTGELPFAAPSAFELAQMHCTAPVPPIPQHFRVPPEVETVIRTAMAKEPKDRHPDASAMALALKSAVSGGQSAMVSAPAASAPPVAVQTQQQVSVAPPAVVPSLTEAKTTLRPPPTEAARTTLETFGESLASPTPPKSSVQTRILAVGGLLAVLIGVLVWGTTRQEPETVPSAIAVPADAEPVRVAPPPPPDAAAPDAAAPDAAVPDAAVAKPAVPPPAPKRILAPKPKPKPKLVAPKATPRPAAVRASDEDSPPPARPKPPQRVRVVPVKKPKPKPKEDVVERL